MSVLTDANQNASSSRVKGIFRYLLHKDNRRESRDKLEKMLSPDSLLRGEDGDAKSRGMIKGTIGECLKMHLLIEDPETGTVSLNPELPRDSLNKRKGDVMLPFTLAGLMLTTENNANRNLALVIAWFLTQDAYKPLGRSWDKIEPILRDQVGSGLLGMNDARYSPFVDWVCFLGFAWRHNLGGENVITPDPTAYLRNGISVVIEEQGGDSLPLGDFFGKLAMQCPVFETGVFRTEIESVVGGRATEQHLSSTTALALFRLQEEKIIHLSRQSDAQLYIFPDGEQTQTYSHIKRV